MDYVVIPAGNDESPEEVKVAEISTEGRVVARGYLEVDYTDGGTPGQSVTGAVRFVGIVVE